jgi:hypothetical protein
LIFNFFGRTRKLTHSFALHKSEAKTRIEEPATEFSTAGKAGQDATDAADPWKLTGTLGTSVKEAAETAANGKW